MKVSIAVDNSSKKYGRGKIASVLVEAEKTLCRGLAVTKRVGTQGYALTHINSGRFVARSQEEGSKERMLAIAGRIAKIEFNFSTFKTYKEVEAAFAKADPKVQRKLVAAIAGKSHKEKK